MHQKKDFHIVFEDHNKFTLRIRKPFLKIFYKWVLVTYQETENSDELPLTFESFVEATNFIANITE